LTTDLPPKLSAFASPLDAQPHHHSKALILPRIANRDILNSTLTHHPKATP
jgi:hypothetical protein